MPWDGKLYISMPLCGQTHLNTKVGEIKERYWNIFASGSRIMLLNDHGSWTMTYIFCEFILY